MECNVRDLQRFVPVSYCFDHLSHLRVAKFNSENKTNLGQSISVFFESPWQKKEWFVGIGTMAAEDCKTNFSLVIFGKQCLWCLGSAGPALCLIP